MRVCFGVLPRSLTQYRQALYRGLMLTTVECLLFTSTPPATAVPTKHLMYFGTNRPSLPFTHTAERHTELASPLVQHDPSPSIKTSIPER